MQKAGLIVALLATVALTIYAYPGADKRSAPLISISGSGHDGPITTGLDKLKAATRNEPQSAVPAPRVMETVRQELSARPATPAGQQSPGQPAVLDEKSIEKLAGKLSAGSQAPADDGRIRPAGEPAVNPRLTSAPLAPIQPATIVLKGPAAPESTVRPSSGESAPSSGKSEPGKSEREHEKQAGIDNSQIRDKASARAKLERRRFAGQDATTARPPAPRGNIRQSYAPNTYTRLDGL